MKKFFSTGLLALCLINVLHGQTIKGKVIDESSKPLPYVSIYIPDLKAGATTDSLGNFSISNIPAGTFSAEVSFIGYSTRVLRLSTDQQIPDITLSASVTEMEELVVTATASFTERARNPVPILPIRRDILLQNAGTNLIDGLSSTPGINQVTTGPAISKPVIRGLGYNRVVVLRNGVRQEGQQWGDEHGVEIDEYEVERMEIVKGPGGLLYGSDAMAGVVNFLTPRPLPEGTHKGEFLTGYQTNGNLIGNSLMYSSTSKGFNWLARVSQKKAGNFRNANDGHVLNSGFEELDASGHIGITRKWGYSQVQVSMWSQKPGLVEGERDAQGNFLMPTNVNGTEQLLSVPESERTGYQNSIGVPYQRISHYRTVWASNFFFGESNLQVTLGWQQNRRKEYGNVLDPEEMELYFKLDTWNADVRYFFPERNGWKVTTGLAAQWQKNENLGAEYLIPAYRSNDLGVYGLVEKTKGSFTFSGGLRYDTRNLHSEGLYLDSNGQPVPPSPSAEEQFVEFNRDFGNTTASAGISWQVSEKSVVRLNVSRGYRIPNLSELGANGVHEGTYRYELGNRNLNAETSLQGDLGFTYNTKHVTAEFNAFYNRINQYVFLEKLQAKAGGDSIVNPLDPVPAFHFVQGDAMLYGGEVSVDIHPHPLDQLHFENAFSFVRGEQVNQPDSMKNLPFMPAPKFQSELRWQFRKAAGSLQQIYLKVDANHFFAQNLIYSAFGTETVTPEYTLVNLGAGAKLINKSSREVMSIYLSCNNLFDVAYQSHLSRLKYAPENPLTGRLGVFNPGRNIGIKLVIPF